jgi:hypothetical protein
VYSQSVAKHEKGRYFRGLLETESEKGEHPKDKRQSRGRVTDGSDDHMVRRAVQILGNGVY